MNLKRRNIKLEAYSRRENIKIFGIENERGEINTRKEELVRIMMREKMNISEEDAEGFQFERVHRIPTRQDMARSSSPAQNTHRALGLLINSLSVNDVWLRQKAETPVPDNLDLEAKRVPWQLYNGCHFMC